MYRAPAGQVVRPAVQIQRGCPADDIFASIRRF